jgi:hypothetical protein
MGLDLHLRRKEDTIIVYNTWLVVSILLKNMKSIGMMTFPTEWKNTKNVPNH